MRSRRIQLLWIVIGLLVVLSGATSLGSEPAETLGPAVVVHFHLSGTLTESPVVDPFGLTAGQVTSLNGLVRGLRRASEDSEVKAVVLTFDSMYLGFAQLEEIRRAIEHVKTGGKKVYVHAEGMTTLVYGLLCAGDHLSVAPLSAVWLTGMYGESLYVKALLDKIGVQADFTHVGDYKSGGEMLTRTGPSDPAQENVNWLFDSLYGSLVEMIAQSRGKTPEEVRDLIDHGPYLAAQALEKGLIDAVETQEEFLVRVKGDVGGQMRVNNRYGRRQRAEVNLSNPLAMFSVLAELFKTPDRSHKDTVAVIYVEGMILPGYSQPTLFGPLSVAASGDIRKALETAAKDRSVKAVVMRVDSPGGSAEASEVILNATRQVQARKPFVVSMGGVAGSGGYYVSCGADAIFADEVTITASIGVLGGKLVTTDMWGKLGVNWVEHKRGANANLFSSARAFDDAQRQLLEDYMQRVYDVFKGHVAQGRGDRLRKPLDQMAGGRVYTGKQAQELGLVDEIGGLQQAIEYAAAKASIEDYEVRVIPEPTDFITQMLEQYSGEGERPSDVAVPEAASLLAGHPMLAPLLDLLRKTEPQRARALYQALQRIELVRRESVTLTMPFDMILQ